MTIEINPGSGPVSGATLLHAELNMLTLCADIGADPVAVRRRPNLDRDGRFGFETLVGEEWIVVEMPGLPAERVRYTGAAEQFARDYPRLYVDGSSWLWKFAVTILQRTMNGEEEG